MNGASEKEITNSMQGNFLKEGDFWVELSG